MARKRQSSLDKNVWTGIIILLSVVVIILLVLVLTYNSNLSEEKALHNEGYNTEDVEDPFYKNVVTNNTLDDYYNAMTNNQNASYEEYYLAKESYNFIELKLNYTDGAATTLNITSDLKTQEVNFNYELSYQSSHLLIEGSSKDTYSCKIITQKNVNQETAKNHCDYVMQEISVFLERRDKLLQNDKVRQMVNSPMKEYVEEE